MSTGLASFVIFGLALLVTFSYAIRPPRPCGPNERLGNCGRICEEKCGEEGMEECARTSCVGSACQCDAGFQRNNETDKCVRPADCPRPRCRDHEGPGIGGKDCEATCEHPSLPEKCRAMIGLRTGCVCDLSRGYVRNQATGNCTRNQDDKECAAKLKCPPNEEQRLCGDVCEPTCRRPQQVMCLLVTENCVIGCHCRDGFVRNQITRRCVRRRQCPRRDEAV